MKAPSEKHLQDYIMENQCALGWFNGASDGDVYLDYEVFKREAVLPSGRADFLATFLNELALSICVIETKKDELTSHSLAQCLRYMRDIRNIWQYAVKQLPDPDPGAMHYVSVPKVSGLLIGARISDDILVSAEGANIAVMLYDYDGSDYEITSISTPIKRSISIDYAYGYIGETIRKTYMEYLNMVFRPEDIEKMPRGLTLDELREVYKSQGLLDD